MVRRKSNLVSTAREHRSLRDPASIDSPVLGVGPSGAAGEALGGELDLFRPPPSMNLVDEWSPTPDSEATKSDKKLE
jgi:hypothetical protein